MPTSLRGNALGFFFFLPPPIDVGRQCTASLIALTSLHSQSNVKTGMQAPHFTADRNKKHWGDIQGFFPHEISQQNFSQLFSHPPTVLGLFSDYVFICFFATVNLSSSPKTSNSPTLAVIIGLAHLFQLYALWNLISPKIWLHSNQVRNRKQKHVCRSLAPCPDVTGKLLFSC